MRIFSRYKVLTCLIREHKKKKKKTVFLEVWGLCLKNSNYKNSVTKKWMKR